ncbi:MAG: nitroreductase family protein [Eubacteriales bacterium]|nr:nitroreductase family protein [Eubacteriales bacterium]
MIHDLVKKNRSYRGYNENRRMTREELTEFADCARLCPSSVNGQPFKYYLAWEKPEVDLIQSMTKWARALPQLTLPHPGMCPTGFIIICQDTRIGENLNRYQKDVGIVAQTMLLAAAEKGLGGCMIGNFSAGEVKQKLNLPEYLAPLLIVAFGEPAEKVVLTELRDGESTAYYRDENDVHYVPKRRLQDVILTAKEQDGK